MKQWSRDTVFAVLLLLVLVGLSSLALFWETQREAQQAPLATFSTQPDGARALWRWVEAIGYRPSTDITGTFSVPEHAALAFILEPELPGITEREWAVLDAWVQAGGTLVIAGEGFGTALSIQHYQFYIDYFTDEDKPVVLSAPLLWSPTPQTLRNVKPKAVLNTSREDVTPILTVDNRPVLVTFPEGDGLVILSTLTYPLSNQGLKEAGNPALTLNLISLAGRSGTIWFDEWHHGRRTEAQEVVSGPNQWIKNTPAGRSLLYAVFMIFIALVLRGQRFGRPIPVPGEQQRRAQIEHVVAVANLNRRAGHRRMILQHYHQELKRKLGYRYRLSPRLPDDEYLTTLKTYVPDLDEVALTDLLARLQANDVSEAEMVELAQQVAQWLET